MEFLKIEEKDKDLIGEIQQGTRIYDKYVKRYAFIDYFDKLIERFGSMLTPGLASIYVGVSRAAVYQRMQAGNLTSFVFRTDPDRVKFLRNKINIDPGVFRSEYFIPTYELRQWRAELIEKSEASFGPRDVQLMDLLSANKEEEKMWKSTKKLPKEKNNDNRRRKAEN